MLTTVLLVTSVVLWTLAAFNVPSTRVSLGWLGTAIAGFAVLLLPKLL